MSCADGVASNITPEAGTMITHKKNMQLAPIVLVALGYECRLTGYENHVLQQTRAGLWPVFIYSRPVLVNTRSAWLNNGFQTVWFKVSQITDITNAEDSVVTILYDCTANLQTSTAALVPCEDFARRRMPSCVR